MMNIPARQKGIRRVSLSDRITCQTEHIEDEVRHHTDYHSRPDALAHQVETAQKIKRDLVQKAKVKRKYAKIRKQELGTPSTKSTTYASRGESEPGQEASTPQQPTIEKDNRINERHKKIGGRETISNEESLDDETLEREALEPNVDTTATPPQANDVNTVDDNYIHPDRKRLKRAKPDPYRKEIMLAETRRMERDVARKAKEAAIQERQRKREERDRWRKAMAKARKPGKNGQRRLGRESSILLEKVQRLVGQT